MTAEKFFPLNYLIFRRVLYILHSMFQNRCQMVMQIFRKMSDIQHKQEPRKLCFLQNVSVIRSERHFISQNIYFEKICENRERQKERGSERDTTRIEFRKTSPRPFLYAPEFSLSLLNHNGVDTISDAILRQPYEKKEKSARARKEREKEGDSDRFQRKIC